MAARQNYYAESTGESTTTSTSYQDKTTLTFTPDASTDYYLIWSALVQRTGTGNEVFCDFHNGTTALCEQLQNPINASAYMPVGGLCRHQEGGSPASRTFKIRYHDGSGGATSKIKAACAIALKANAADQYAESTASASTNTNTYGSTDKVTLTFTPASLGDYLIIASAELQTGVAGAIPETRIDIDGSAQVGTQQSYEIGNTSDWVGSFIIHRVSLSAASHTIKLQYRRTTAGGTNITIRNGRILAIRLDTLDNNYYDEDRTRVTYNTNTSSQDGSTFTQTPVAADHLLLGNGVVDASNTTNGVRQLLDEGGSVLAQHDHYNGTITRGFLAISRRSLTASSTTWKTRYGTANTGTTVGFAESALALIQLDATPGGGGSISRRWYYEMSDGMVAH